MKDKKQRHYGEFILDRSKAHWDMVKDLVHLNIGASNEVILIDPEAEAKRFSEIIEEKPQINQAMNIVEWQRRFGKCQSTTELRRF